jgi:hypothetical protein
MFAETERAAIGGDRLGVQGEDLHSAEKLAKIEPRSLDGGTYPGARNALLQLGRKTQSDTAIFAAFTVE